MGTRAQRKHPHRPLLRVVFRLRASPSGAHIDKIGLVAPKGHQKVIRELGAVARP